MSPPEPESVRNELSGSGGQVVQARDVSGGIHFHTAPDPVVVPRQLPTEARGFVNRTAELGQLSAAAGALREPVRLVALVGTAGAGKTSVVVRFAHRIRAEFPDGQLYVDLRGYDERAPQRAEDVLGRFLLGLGVAPERIPADGEARADLYRSMTAGRRLLIVLDNANSPTQVRPLLPADGGHLVLVTSRNRLSGLVARDGARRVTLDKLQAGESVMLLRAAIGDERDDDDSELAELAGLCAHLPLALRIAAEYAATHPWMASAELIAELRDESGRWEVLAVDEESDRDTVRAVFDWSYNALIPEAARMFRLLGLHPGIRFGVPAAAALARVPVRTARRQLDALVAAHLLEEVGNDRYQFHDLLRAYAVRRLRADETPVERRNSLERVLTWYLHTVLRVSRTADRVTFEPRDMTPPDPEMEVPVFADSESARAWYQLERANLLVAVECAAEAGLFRVAAQLPLAAVSDVSWGADPRGTWTSTLGTSLTAARELGDLFAQASLSVLAAIDHRLASRLESALAAYEQAGSLFQELGDEYGRAVAHNGAGIVARKLRRLDIAVSQLERARSLLGHDGPAQIRLAVQVNLADAWRDLGDPMRAEALVRPVVADCRAEGMPYIECEALSTLASVLRATGRIGEARDAVEQMLAVAASLDSSPIQAYARNQLVRLELADSRPAEALSLGTAVADELHNLAMVEQEGSVRDLVGRSLHALGRPMEAVAEYRRAAELHRNAGESWLLALDLDHLADALDAVGDTDAATQARIDALELLTLFTDPVAAELRARIRPGADSGSE